MLRTEDTPEIVHGTLAERSGVALPTDDRESDGDLPGSPYPTLTLR